MVIAPGGEHCILELSGCPSHLLVDEARVRDAVAEATNRCGATMLNLASHSFDPPGVTVVAMLAESHISVHTWPAEGYVAVDVFTCGTTANPRRACEYLSEALQADQVALKTVARRPGGDPDLQFDVSRGVRSEVE